MMDCRGMHGAIPNQEYEMSENATETKIATPRPTKGQRPTPLQHNWFVLQMLVSKDFKLKYRRSVLGVLWSVLNPLLMMIVLTAVFSFVFRFKIENFPLYLILGTITFDLMSHSTGDAMRSILDAQALIKKVRIEKMVFPLEKVLFELLNFAISLVAVVAVMVFFQEAPDWNIIWGLPLFIIMITLFCTGLSLLLATLAVFFRDVMHLWSVILTAWTYATPLFYPFDVLAPWMQDVMQFNPMYHYVSFFRAVMTGNFWQTNMDIAEVGICLGMAVVTFVIGFWAFRKHERNFILHI